jgi:hypothetical protein
LHPKKLSFGHMAQSDVVVAAVGQRPFFGPSGRGTRSESVDCLADRRTLHLMVARKHKLDGTVEVDYFNLVGRPRAHAYNPPPEMARNGQAKTEETPIMGIVRRPADNTPGSTAGDTRAIVVNRPFIACCRGCDCYISLASCSFDEYRGEDIYGHWRKLRRKRIINHSCREYVLNAVHFNSVGGFNSWVRRTIAGVFHHISPEIADLNFQEISFCWSQHIVIRQASRKSRSGKEGMKTVGRRCRRSIINASVPRDYGVRWRKPGWRHHHQISRRCLWLINASQDFEQILLRPFFGQNFCNRFSCWTCSRLGDKIFHRP